MRMRKSFYLALAACGFLTISSAVSVAQTPAPRAGLTDAASEGSRAHCRRSHQRRHISQDSDGENSRWQRGDAQVHRRDRGHWREGWRRRPCHVEGLEGDRALHREREGSQQDGNTNHRAGGPVERRDHAVGGRQEGESVASRGRDGLLAFCRCQWSANRYGFAPFFFAKYALRIAATRRSSTSPGGFP